MGQTAIQTRALTRDFESVRALDSLTLEIQAGSIFGFLGPNGAGKTTTIRLLLGLLSPTSGTARVLGSDTAEDPAAIRQRTGALLDHTGLYERLTAEENLEFYGRVWQLDAGARRKRSQELLERIGLWERRTERPIEWSRGMRQQLALARALIHSPDLLILDEPTAGLDVLAAEAVRERLAALVADRGMTVFLTTHNMVEAERLCDEVAVINSGCLVAHGSPEQVRGQHDDLEAAFLALVRTARAES